MPPPPNLDILLQQLQYPAMTWVESRITQAWLEEHGAAYDRIEFNIRLGRGISLGEGFGQETQRMAELVTQKRADIVAYSPDQVTIIEVKVRVTFTALGQLLGYRLLWQQANPDSPPVRLMAIGRAIVPDAESLFRGQGVEVLIFPRVPAE